ncbi:MAG TPA: citrate/2-methylcitrate synthase [Steroidobacteraceae bacterium]
MAESTTINKGLEGVIVNTTSVSHVDGEAGRLYYRGEPIESLAQRRFAEVMHLVVFGSLPDAARLSEVEEYLWEAGRLPPEFIATLRQLARHGAHPMATLQAVTPLLALEPPAVRLGRTAAEEEGLLIAARIPAVVATIRAALEDHPDPVYPSSRRYGERFLQMFEGADASPDAVDVFEATQILQLDHSFNASTFTSRVVTSTDAPPASALAAAMGALFGAKHGAADQLALEMAQEVGDPKNSEAFVAQCLANRRLVMGMGHREYRVVDPRARIIKALTGRCTLQPETQRLLEILCAVEESFIAQTAAKRRPLRANMEFYKGIVYLALGIPKEFFTTLFAASRAFGWTAHIVEQRQDNRIIRPAAQYVGPEPRAS